MTSRQAKIQEDTHFRIMRILQENPDLTQRELAEKLGMSVGGLNYCLNALIDKGLVKMQNFSNSKNKFKYPSIIGLAFKRFRTWPPSGCGPTTMIARIWPWAASPQSSIWPRLHNRSTFKAGGKRGYYRA